MSLGTTLKDFWQINKLCNCRTKTKQYRYSKDRTPNSRTDLYSMTLSDGSEISAWRDVTGIVDSVCPYATFSITVNNHGDMPQISATDSTLLAWLTYQRFKLANWWQNVSQKINQRNNVGR